MGQAMAHLADLRGQTKSNRNGQTVFPDLKLHVQ